MRFGKYNKDNFEPQSHAQGKQIFKNDSPYDEVIFNPGREIDETNNALKQISKSLSEKQLLEIGENPAYFIVKQNHKSREQLLDTDIWDDLKKQSLSKNSTQTNFRKTTSSNGFSQQVSQRLYKNPSESQFKLTIYSQNNQAELKKQAFQKYQIEYLKRQNNSRKLRFEENQQEQNKIKEKKIHDLRTKYESKMVQAQKALDKIEIDLQQQQEYKKQMDFSKNSITQQNRMKKKEEQDIQNMNAELRSFCLQNTNATTQDIEQGKLLFNKLRDSGDIGKNLVETIELELSTAQGEDQTIVSRVIEMLKEIQTTLMQQQEEFKSEVGQKNEACFSQVSGLKEDIKELDEKIDQMSDVLPLRNDEYELKLQQLDSSKEEYQFYIEQLQQIETKAQQRRQQYLESKEEHDQMIAALEQAKRLIQKLTNSFVEKNSNVNFAQITSHFEMSKNNMIQSHNKAFLTYLAQVSKVADQNQVEQLLNIIDDLINQIVETSGIEAKAEAKRQERVQNDRDRYKANIEQADANIKEVESDIGAAKLRLRELKEELEFSQATRDSKQSQLDDHRRSCTDQTQLLSTRIANYDEILDIIRQVLVLLEHSSIRGAKNMLSDLDPNKPKEESLLGSYNTDSGQLPSRTGGQGFLQRNNKYDPLDN